MSGASNTSTRRVLEPISRVSETLFGVIMVLTFTLSLSVANVGRDDVRLMLIGALGCNIAWGIIDAILYLMGSLAEKSTGIKTLRAVRRATDPQKARKLMTAALPPAVAQVIEPGELDSIHQRLKTLTEPPAYATLHKDDWRGAIGVFLLVFLSTFPMAIPFMFMQNANAALRVSNAVAIVLLFLLGYAFGQITGRRPWVMGVAMVILGTILVGICLALGG
jgi:VIT1/CCC1 family predicted Fe2+/Mn2+ transporter